LRREMAKERSQEEVRSRRRRRQLAGKVGVAMGAAGLLLFIVGIKRPPEEIEVDAYAGAPDGQPGAPA
jgi:hypothetical protein